MPLNLRCRVARRISASAPFRAGCGAYSAPVRGGHFRTSCRKPLRFGKGTARYAGQSLGAIAPFLAAVPPHARRNGRRHANSATRAWNPSLDGFLSPVLWGRAPAWEATAILRNSRIATASAPDTARRRSLGPFLLQCRSRFFLGAVPPIPPPVECHLASGMPNERKTLVFSQDRYAPAAPPQ